MQTKTEILIEATRELAESIDSVDGVANAVIFEAAQRLDELQTALKSAHASLVLARNERDKARAEVKLLTSAVCNSNAQQLDQALHERDEARAEVERLKANSERLNQELCEAKGWLQDWRPEWVRKDPSRLEIAAMIMGAQPPPQAGSFSGQAEHALRRADALIAAAKEAK